MLPDRFHWESNTWHIGHSSSMYFFFYFFTLFIVSPSSVLFWSILFPQVLFCIDSCTQYVNCTLKNIYCVIFTMHPANEWIWFLSSILQTSDLIHGKFCQLIQFWALPLKIHFTFSGTALPPTSLVLQFHGSVQDILPLWRFCNEMYLAQNILSEQLWHIKPSIYLL